MNTNVKKSTAPAPAADSARADELALVQPGQAAQAEQALDTAQSENQGRGGLYTVINGVRKRVSGTKHPTANKEEA